MNSAVGETVQSAAPERPPSTARPRVEGAAFYVLVALVATLLTIPVFDLLHATLSVPFGYAGDARAGSVHIKGLLETGWISDNPAVGAPWGRHGNDFPIADNLHLIVMAGMGLFTSSFAVVLNLYFLLTFPLIALAAAWWFRTLGMSRVLALVLAQLYAFAPYHFWRGEAHLFLAGYYAVPLAAVLLHRVLAGERLWSRRPDAIGLGGWFTARNAGTVGCLAVLGASSSYYSVFTLLLLTAAALIAVLQHRRWKALVGVVVAQGWLIAVMVANMAPNLLYQQAHLANLVVPSRGARGTEFSSFKLTSLLLPWGNHRSETLAHFRRYYDTVFPLPSEIPALGAIASVGLLFLLGVVVVSACSPRRAKEEGPGPVHRRLGVLALLTLLLGTVGGFATLFALFVNDSLRGWNRLSIFLAVFTLAAVGLLLDEALAWHRARGFPLHRATAGLVVGLLLGVGLYDQTPPDVVAQRAAVATSWDSDTRFVATLEERLPRDAMVFQLPHMPYPESRPIVKMRDSDQFRMYLHSSTLRWSYGAIRGRPDSDWPVAVSRAPTPVLTTLVSAAGFSGIQLDRFGYGDSARALEAELLRLLGEQPVVSADDRYSFWDLRAHTEGLRATHGAAALDELGRRVVLHPVGYEIGSPRAARPSVVLENPMSTPQTVNVTITVIAGAVLPAQVKVQWPDGTSELLTSRSANFTAHRRLLLAPGRSTAQLSLVAPVRKGKDPITLTFGTVLVDDPLLTGFAP